MLRHARRKDTARGATRQKGMKSVTVQHAAAIIIDQLLGGDPSRRNLDAGVFHPSRNRVAAETGMAILALVVKPIRPLLNDVTDPKQRLDIVNQRRPIEDTDLGDIGRPMAGIAALALNRLDHSRFLAADIGAGAASKMNARVRDEPLGFQSGDFKVQQIPDLWILIAEIEITILGLHDPGGDQHAFQRAMRIAFEIVPVLESSGLALVGVDR